MLLTQKFEKPAIAKTGMSGASVGVPKSPSPACRLLPPFARVSESACAGLKELLQFADQGCAMQERGKRIAEAIVAKSF
jgi:hypothetical protein